jgi:NAD(P)H-dependent FMN reductase
MNNKIKILAITGAVRTDSQTTKLAQISKKYFKADDVEFTVFDLRKSPLPMYDAKESLNNSNVQLLLTLTKDADGLVFISPEYHGSMSGALKNALDWMYFLEDIDFLHGKVVGIMGGGGSFGNSGATVQLMMATRALHAWLMPDVIVNVPKIRKALGEDDLVDELYKTRMTKFAHNLIKYTKMFKENREVFSL